MKEASEVVEVIGNVALLGFRQLLPAGLERRRQLGDLEFSNRYAEFLRSRAKHTSICAFLQRMQDFKKRWAPFSQTTFKHLPADLMTVRRRAADDLWLLFSHPQWGGGQHREGQPAAETVHVSVRLARRPVSDALQR